MSIANFFKSIFKKKETEEKTDVSSEQSNEDIDIVWNESTGELKLINDGAFNPEACDKEGCCGDPNCKKKKPRKAPVKKKVETKEAVKKVPAKKKTTTPKKDKE